MLGIKHTEEIFKTFNGLDIAKVNELGTFEDLIDVINFVEINFESVLNVLLCLNVKKVPVLISGPT